jgi:hypothetical protein
VIEVVYVEIFMIKKVLIGIGTLIILALLGLWSYLLFFGTPQTVNEVFVDLGLQATSPERPEFVAPNAPLGEKEILALGVEDLSQLTTRLVAGYIHLSNNQTDILRYAERGTGHVYDINFKTNTETRVLGNTIAKTSRAYFSPDGDLMVIAAEADNEELISLVTIPNNTNENSINTALKPNLKNITVLSSTTINYTEVEDNKTVGYSFNRFTGVFNEIWRIPLTDIEVIWENGITYVLTKPAPFLKGALYQISSEGLIPVTAQQYNYTAVVKPGSNNKIETYFDVETNNLTSQIKFVNNEFTSPIIALPEKCTFSPVDQNKIWCGSTAPGENNHRTFIRDWYMGLANSNDYLWEIDVNTKQATVMVNFITRMGYVVDVIEPTFSKNGNKLFFINKINDSLWLYKIPNTSS